MTRISRKAMAILTLVLFVLSASLFAYFQEDAEKKYAHLVGDYEFDMEGQLMVVSFWVEDGKLMGAPEGETPEELEPVEGEDLKFEINTADGQFMELEFVKDESGKVTEHIVTKAVSAVLAFDTDLTVGGRNDAERYDDIRGSGDPAIRVICVVDRGYWYWFQNTWKTWEQTYEFEEVVGFIAGVMNTYRMIAATRKEPRLGRYLRDN